MSGEQLVERLEDELWRETTVRSAVGIAWLRTMMREEADELLGQNLPEAELKERLEEAGRRAAEEAKRSGRIRIVEQEKVDSTAATAPGKGKRGEGDGDKEKQAGKG